MLIVDGHLDLAWNALYYDRDLLRPVGEIRAAEMGLPGAGRGAGTVAFPEMRQGRVMLAMATLLARNTGAPVPAVDFGSWPQAYASAQGQLAYYRGLEAAGHARIVSDSDTLVRHVAEWNAWEVAGAAPDMTPRLGLVLSMEGADPIRDPDALLSWWDAGLRIIGITHYGPGRYAAGTGCDGGLTPMGESLLDAMARRGFALDLTHCANAAFQQAIERFEGPVLASHHNCRALVPGDRQLTDEQIRAIARRGGVIGMALDVWMLEPGFRRGRDTNDGITLERAADHIDHVCQVAGSARHAAIGSDLDGLFGLEQSPCDLDSIADLRRIAGYLAKRGYASADIADVCHGNWIGLLDRALPRGVRAIMHPS